MKTPKKHILIVEDNEFLRKMMQKVISAHGIRVTTAVDGKAAIDQMKKESPDLMLLDLLLPHVDGYEVLKNRKDQGMTFPVIVCSNISDKANRDRCKAFGATGYVVKSDMDDEQLWPIIEKHLS